MAAALRGMAVVLFLGAGAGWAQGVVGTPVPAGSDPKALAVNPVTKRVYVANFGTDTVTVLNGVTNATTTVTVGTFPDAVAVNLVTNQIYVANYGATRSGHTIANPTVTVIDGATNSTTSVTVGTTPQALALAVNPVTNEAYVASFVDGIVTVLNGSANPPVALSPTVTVGTNPIAVTVNPVTNLVYVANEYDGTVTVIAGLTNTVTATPGVGSQPLFPRT
jgi:YVTN family beta-propeller protein